MPFGGMVDPEGECIRHEAHISLQRLKKSADKWVQSERESNVITTLLHGLYLVDQREPVCLRFSWMASLALLGIPSHVWFAHPFFWDVFGAIGGRAVRAGDLSRSRTILKRCMDDFSEADWSTRPYIVKAIRSIAHNCVFPDRQIESDLRSYRIRCQAAIDLIKKVPKPLGDTLTWLLDAWAEIAQECRAEQRRALQSNSSLTHAERETLRGRIGELMLSIIREAIQFFQIYEKSVNLGSPYVVNCWPHWCQMVEPILPKRDWTPEEIGLIGTPEVEAEVAGLLGVVRPAVSRWNDPAKWQAVQALEVGLSAISTLQSIRRSQGEPT